MMWAAMVAMVALVATTPVGAVGEAEGPMFAVQTRPGSGSPESSEGGCSAFTPSSLSISQGWVSVAVGSCSAEVVLGEGVFYPYVSGAPLPLGWGGFVGRITHVGQTDTGAYELRCEVALHVVSGCSFALQGQFFAGQTLRIQAWPSSAPPSAGHYRAGIASP
jgi:hypothetical protein